MAVAMIGPKFYAWDRNGNPLAFGKLYTYQARTNVPKDTYQSEDQVVPNTNPVILNGEGYAGVYLYGSYKMVLKDKDENEIWSSDPVTSNNAEEWTNCQSAEYLSATEFRIVGNVTDTYDDGRNIRINDGGSVYKYATIKTSIFAGGYTNIELFSPVVTTNISQVCASIVGKNATGPLSDDRYVSTFSSVENLKLALTNDNGQITAEQITARDIPAKTHGYYGGWAALVEPSGSSDYLLTTLQRVRDTKANQSWVPDGYGDHYLSLGDGQTYVAMLQVDSETTVRNFGARNGSSSSDDVTANIQACNDHDQIAKVKLGKIDCYAQGLVINKNISGDSMTSAFIRAIDNTVPCISIPDNTRRRSMSDFSVYGTSKLIPGSKGIKFGHNVSRGEVKDIDIQNFESGLFSDLDASMFMQRFSGVLVGQAVTAFNFDGFDDGYTTLTFTNCYATNVDVGFKMGIHYGLLMENCAVDYATSTPFQFSNCRNVVLNSLYSEGCELSGSVPGLILIFNCEGFSLDGFFSFNQTALDGGDHALVLINKTASCKDITIKNTFYRDTAGGNEILFRSTSSIDATTNIIVSSNSQKDALIQGDIKIRNLDYESIPLRAQTDSSGKVVLDFSDIPSYLLKVVTASVGGSSGNPAQYTHLVEQGGSFANVYIADFSGVIQPVSGVSINTLISCGRN